MPLDPDRPEWPSLYSRLGGPATTNTKKAFPQTTKMNHIDRLPPELNDIIFTFTADDNPASLTSLGSVSKRFYHHSARAGNSIRFRDIPIKVCKIHGLGKSTEKIVEWLQRTSSFHYVRRLIMEEEHLAGCEHNQTCKMHGNWRPPRLHELRRKDMDEPYEPTYAAALQEMPWCSITRDGDFDADRRNNAWKPVVDLIERLPALTDLFFRCGSPVPPGLLDALHRPNSKIKLHLQTFSIQGLTAPTPDADGFKLITAPSLHSIMLQCNEKAGYSDEHTPCYPMETLHRLVRLAPNLKEVQITRREVSTSFTDVPIPQSGHDLTLEEGAPSLPMASFKCLRIIDQIPLTAMTLLEWGKHTDFSELESLELFSLAETSALKSWSRHLRFPKLKSLCLQLKAYPYLGERPPTPAFYKAANRFISSLPPLQELYLEGWHSRVAMYPLVKQHGCRLRKLNLEGCQAWQCAAESDIRQLGKHCPLLESLELMIPRSQGDATEVALYRALGTIPRLKYLYVALDVSDASLGRREDDTTTLFPTSPNRSPNRDFHAASKPPSEPLFDEFGNQLSAQDLGGIYRSRNGHVQRLLRNSAIDSRLARSIFRAISATKPPGSVPLERMVIRRRCSAFERSAPFSQLAHLFPCAWSVERNPRDDRRDEVIATELALKTECPHGDADLPSRDLEPWQQTVFRSVWPTTRGMSDGAVGLGRTRTWWDEWYSFPLAL
ncbi:hypothetical protein BDV28DRAFT_88013 [Aspergillus coremiiformis]|uniref:F-box domain-containing protein n=1 Tax=Aspergillus coremiiformis TaxID=138285 RepID=A0A5N6YSR9_9EURO|nr:hypothetical protein BDV28DRAFT_88013 [Aspergillus coremiiformis]